MQLIHGRECLTVHYVAGGMGNVRDPTVGFARFILNKSHIQAIESMWNVILFVEISHRKMDARTACAPLHLAWHKLNDGYFRKKQ